MKRHLSRVLLHVACGMLGFVAFLAAGCEKWVQERIDTNIKILKDKDASKERRSSAAASLGRIGKPAIPALFALMRPQYLHAEYYIGYAFGAMGPQGYPAVIKGLGDQEPFVRGSCASILIGCAKHLDNQTSAAVAGLNRMLAHDADEPALQMAAVMALEKFGPAARSAVSGILSATLSDDWTLCETAAKAIKAIEPESLNLVPQPPTEGKGFFGSFKTHSDWNTQRLMAVMGRLCHGRQDLNGDWKLARNEIATVPLLVHTLDKKKGAFLTFADAGEAVFSEVLDGYAAGNAERRKMKKEDVQRELTNTTVRKGVAVMFISSLRSADADHDGVLSQAEHEAWRRKN